MGAYDIGQSKVSSKKIEKMNFIYLLRMNSMAKYNFNCNMIKCKVSLVFCIIGQFKLNTYYLNTKRNNSKI